jgi:tRNA threonylcarbamoyl adenosine modification protein (Sua5/YciO/YrdC/YwlC family)
MKILKLEAALKDMDRVELAKAIREGKIIIYPAGTFYAIGCNVEAKEGLEKIINVKGDKLFAVMTPSKQWIAENTKIMSDTLKFIDQLFPGPYEVILKLKNASFHPSFNRRINICMPRDKFCEFIRSQGFPFILTPATNEVTPPSFLPSSIRDIPTSFTTIADYIIDAGELSGEVPRVFDLSGKELVILRW